jgi:hypothetical protein
MRAQGFETPMNADVTPMNAECSGNGLVVQTRAPPSESSSRSRPDHELSAFIGVTSAFIGVSKTCARITPRP